MKIFLLFLLFYATILRAQTESTSANTSTTPAIATESSVANEVERVTVVGSRIKRIVKEEARQEIKINKESMRNSANLSLSETLRDSSSAMSGSTQYSSFVISNIGLNGMDASKTLILLNGHRYPADPGFDAVDLNAIPQSAVERIEILKDGASAIYGSDAIGGVINIVTKKGVRGTEFVAKYSTPEQKGGTAFDLSATTGVGNDKHDLTISASYQQQFEILGRDREATKSGLRSIGPAASWRGVGQPTYVLANPGDCDPSLIGTDPTGQHCFYRFNEVATARPDLKQLNLLTDYSYRFDSGLKFYNRNSVVYRDIGHKNAPYGRIFETPAGTASNPNAREVQVVFSELGLVEAKDKELNYNTLIGLNKSISPNLEIDISAGYAEINQYNRGVSGDVNGPVLQGLIDSQAIDPLAPIGSRGNFEPAKIQSLYKYLQRLLTVDGLISGDLADLNNGPLGFAAGLSVMADKQIQYGDDVGYGVYDAQGSREVYSAFGELSYNILKNLELDGALRFDAYSDMGTTLNPKLSVKYTLSDTVLVRSSVGTSFKAPRYYQMYMAESDGFRSFIDRRLCQTNPSKCAMGTYHAIFSGNNDLKEEKAFTASLGTVIQPVQNFSFSVDGWYSKVTNLIDIDLEALTQAEVNGVNPQGYGVTVTRDPGTGEITEIRYKNLNLTNRELAGMDVNVQNTIPRLVGGLDFVIEDDYSYMMFDKYEGFPGAGQRNQMGEWEKPYWRNKIQFKLKDELQEFKISMRSIPGSNVQDRYIDRKVSDLNEWDLDYSRAFSSQISAAFGIKNIMNTEQPVDAGGGEGGSNVISQSLYDINGRRFFISYSQKF